jgi:hypothetical protein
MKFLGLGRKRFLFLAVIVLACGASRATHAQSRPGQGPSGRNDARSKHTSPQVFEDSEVRIAVPVGWRIVPREEMLRNDGVSVSLGNSVSQPKGGLILERNGYTLSIAYDTDHASPVEGGRFLEVFNIPWPDVDDGSNCALYPGGDAQPASRVLVFRNITVDTSDLNVQKNCGIPESLGHCTADGCMPYLNGERRWFGGFFTTAAGGLFFNSLGDECGQKAYTLTTKAKTADHLPVPADPKLEKVIQQAIDIVDSIHYKRCAPSGTP